MALVTVQRSPSVGNSPQSSDSGTEDEITKNGRSLRECYFAGKGAAVVLGSGAAAASQPPPTASSQPQPSPLLASSPFLEAAGLSVDHHHQHPAVPPPELQSTAAPPPPASATTLPDHLSSASAAATSSSDIQNHLQSMFYLLKPEETLKMAVKLESVHPGRTRYLVVVSRLGRQETEESCLLGIDCNHRTTVGLVLRVLADTAITLDGDGGFSVSSYGRHHIFKPVSVQAMWSALQTLHKVSSKAREHNYFLSGLSHDWVSHYEASVSSDQSCLNEWHAMDSLQSRRPPSPDSLRHKPREREETEQVIRSSLKEIMMSVDLDEVTSKQVRSRLEEALDMDLAEYKSFIDEEMLVILGQMDEATEIFPHVYLGSEWNASNLEELNKNGVCHILNVTREIDNFFPGMFDYLNVRVYDDEKTDLLKHWDDTFKYITKAKKDGSKVLVHCKMGISRSASVVIAYAMKAYSWDLKKALTYVQNKRQCIKPNSNFIAQLETYQGILDAMKNREKLQRSKSETNLKWKEGGGGLRNSVACQTEGEAGAARGGGTGGGGEELLRVAGCRSASEGDANDRHLPVSRPKSWSPDYVTANNIFSAASQEVVDDSLPVVTLDNCDITMSEDPPPTPPPPPPPLPPFSLLPSPSAGPPPPPSRSHSVNVRLPCNGLTYSVSQNKILHLPCSQRKESLASTVMSRVSALELQRRGGGGGRQGGERKGLVLNLTSHFEEEVGPGLVTSGAAPPAAGTTTTTGPPSTSTSASSVRSSSSSAKDPFSSQVDRLFEREETSSLNPPQMSRGMSCSWVDGGSSGGVPTASTTATTTGVCRQSSWGSGDTGTGAAAGARGGGGRTGGGPPARNSSWGSYDLRLQHPHQPEIGKVKELKAEFEAKSSSSVSSSGALPPAVGATGTSESLPSSPTSEQCDRPSPSPSLEELSVRQLVGRYEAPVPRPRLPPPPPLKAAVVPRVLVTSVLAKAAHKKQQQGKTHPLARLTRHNNPVYNTM